VENLAAHRMLGRSRCKEGKGDRGKVWFYDLSRSSGKVRKLEGRFDGVCPCLTTRNGTLWVEAAQSPKYRRFLSFGERFAMQGLPSELADTFSLKGASQAASGNAMAVNCLGLCIACCYADKV
ncbi:unnamed protein product, partial [Prorocentrum cordatum]